ncbi:hypothetical protein [Ramlibacter rhizophilus]|uniref:NodB homology domain-containing protein n=1 Tax=Ramlibacter rhizophilus TaxID=1781167 RepID=A0A4Z0BER3_9BURK|nr:hypothetical protein [Ramlibacter rhizophilus]TFY96879.1 hypothetical protein EZ242_19595 [Ramlibacter rhizophilus]
MTSGTFVLSLDCEGKWGVADQIAPHHSMLSSRKLEATYRRLVEMLDRYGIEATFAFTTAFTLTRQQFRRLWREHGEDTARTSGWMTQALSHVDRDGGDGWFVPACLDAVSASRGGHELACHGFSHLPWRHPIASRAAAAAELSLTRCVPGFGADAVTTFVFPRNQLAHLDLLPAHGFTAYRDAPRGGSRLATLARECGLWDRSETFTHCTSDPLARLPAGRFVNWRHGLRCVVPAAVTVQRWTHIIRDAQRTGGVVHAWTHPENFIDGHGMFEMFEQILQRVAQARAAGGLQVRTMRSIAADSRARARTESGAACSTFTDHLAEPQ